MSTDATSHHALRRWLPLAAWALSVVLLGILLRDLDGAAPAVPSQRVVPIAQQNLSGVTWDGEGLWLTVDGEGAIYRVDPETGAVDRRFDFPVAETGGSAWDGDSLWQLAYAEKQLYRLDPASGEILDVLPAPGGMCSGVTFDGRHLWLASWEDGKLYQVDPNDGGRVVTTLDADLETTGLAWDGHHLWNGVLVGTESHDEETPYTGFVQQRDLATGTTLQVLPVHGVFAGDTDWLPGADGHRRAWWYDGYHEQLIELRWGDPDPHRVPRRLGWALLALAPVLLSGLWPRSMS